MKTVIQVLLYLHIAGCGNGPKSSLETPSVPGPKDKAYRQAMRDFVQNISIYAKGINPDFVVIPQNGEDIISENGDANEPPDTAYLNAIDGIGREDLFYGYEDDDQATDVDVTNEIIAFLDIYKNSGLRVLVSDYTWTRSKINDSYRNSAAHNYISFAAERRELDNIPSHPPKPFRENSSDITALADANNFLYLLNPGNTRFFADRDAYLTALRETNYDLLIIDAFYEDILLIASEVESLKQKKNGGRRMVIGYLSIGEAEDYRYYWQPAWNSRPPSWLGRENENFPGNFLVQYWDEEWQSIIYGNDDSYLKKILDAGFDGVYLDLIDAFEVFENQ